MRRWCLWLCLSFPGCGALGVPRMPAELADVPWRGAPGDADVLAARAAYDRGEGRAALASVERVLAEHPRHVDAHRLRQDILRDRGRVGRVRREAEDRVAAWDDDARAWYLRARIAPGDVDKLALCRAALERQPDLFWGWLGQAFALRNRDPDQSLSRYRDMYGATGGHPLVAVALGSALRAAERYPEALQVYDALRESSQLPGVGELGMAETYLAADRRRDAWAPLLEALRRRPFDAGVRRLIEQFVAHGLPQTQVEQVLSVLWEEPRTRLDEFMTGSGAPLLAAMFERLGHRPAASEVLRARGGPTTAAGRRHWRRLLLSSGDVAGFLAAFAESVPRHLVDDERNQVRGPWVGMLGGPWMRTGDPLADVGVAADLVRALTDCGRLIEAELLATLALLRHGDSEGQASARLHELRHELRRELSFQAGVGRLVYRGYADGSDRQRTLAQLIEDLRRLSLEVHGRDVVGEPRIFRVPLVGRLVDPFGPGLGQHLARYNKHLVLGQRDGAPAEGLLLTRLSMRYIEATGPLALPDRCWQVVGDNREIQSLQGVLGGDLAGVALWQHYVIDYDAVRDWAQNLRDRRVIVREDDAALLDDPLPEHADALDPVDVHWRLPMLSSASDDELDAAVFEMICWHERAHLVDAFHFLPPERNLWRVLGLLFGHGFSGFSIESEMEARAETVALARSVHTELVLAHIASFLEGDPDESPHAEGFRRLAQRLNEALAQDPELRPFARVHRWHLVPPDRMRRIAATLPGGS